MSQTLIADISRQSLEKLNNCKQATIADVRLLSSYNWIDAPKDSPTIVVPGIPGRWSPPARHRRLPKDSGMVYVNQNAARHPASPMEPLFRAVHISQPAFDFSSVDIVTDRNSLRKLLSFINPSSARNGLEAFTINIEVVQNTVIFTRDTKLTYEIIGKDEFRGYGHQFEKAYTTRNIIGSTGHNRIISYNFGGHKLVVRHDLSGYVPGKTLTTNDDEVVELLDSLSLSPKKRASTEAGPGSKLRVRREGHLLPRASTLEIKTRAQHKSLPFNDIAAQLWMSQTPNLVRAYHRGGTFSNPEVEDVTAKLNRWEKDNRSHLKRLAALIGRILTLVRKDGGVSGAVLQYNPTLDRLSVWKTEKGRTLPEDIYLLWRGRLSVTPPTAK
ncbi:hypothetical protein jhhlp_000484 [Lomentospora prolificans]|uniref:Geranylgeranyl pyrophosphate synthetase n=1 Tax=Lomentospora prolificans TaxID=41688 RepID=A0A2N3NL90_9PEZI|nr:hypothetical protein jhhlp_000484 [Lomentospora prolificans]